MATWDDVSRLALALPETVELVNTGGLHWDVRRNYFAWERPLRKVDLQILGDAIPSGPILGVRVADADDKRGLMGSNPEVFFTIRNNNDYPAVLVLLEKVSLDQLEEVLTDAWLSRAPKRLAAQFLIDHPEIAP